MISKRLGKLPKREDPRTLKLGHYLSLASLPIIPDRIDWGAKVIETDWGVMGNDVLGDCAIAAPAHQIQGWTANAPGSSILTIPDERIVDAYCDVGGYVRGDPSTDNGCVMLDVLKYWRSSGIAGHKILAFAEIDPTHPAMVRAAQWLFGGLYAGFGLPLSAQDQQTWDFNGFSGRGAVGSWGGHAVYLHQKRPDGAACVTWGYSQAMTDKFIGAYCDELYAVISDDWLAQGKTIHGFDRGGLLADLQLVTT